MNPASGNCCYQKQNNSPTVRPTHFFLPNEDAEDLWKTLHADVLDVAIIIEILAKRSLAQRLQIIAAYQNLHDANLVEDLKDKLSGDIEDLIVAMMTSLDEYYAQQLHQAVAGLGTDESDLIEVLCSLTNATIKAIKCAYNRIYNVKLVDDIKDDTSGNFKTLLVSLCNTERDENSPVDHNAACTDAEALNTSTSDNRWDIFSDILLHRSFAQLRLIFKEFEQLSGKDMETTVKDDFFGDVEDGLVAIVELVKDPAGFFAKKLQQSMAGPGTRDNDLIRIVVTRSEIDMGDIKKEYEAQFSKTLAAAIIDDTSGDYKTCLLTLIGEA